jgi:1,4-alpha-glucan branching enzyme
LVLNTDATEFGGSGVELVNRIKAKEEPIHGLPYSASINLPPMATLWFDAPVKKEQRTSPVKSIK